MVNICAFSINIIVYIALVFPLIISLFIKKIFINKKNVLCILAISMFVEAILSFLLYRFPYEIFSIFTSTSGIVNLSVFISRIVFLDSSLYGLKFFLPAFLIKRNKKAAIFILLKIATNVILATLGYLLFSISGLLYSFPLCDIIFYIVFIFQFKNS